MRYNKIYILFYFVLHVEWALPAGWQLATCNRLISMSRNPPESPETSDLLMRTVWEISPGDASHRRYLLCIYTFTMTPSASLSHSPSLYLYPYPTLSLHTYLYLSASFSDSFYYVQLTLSLHLCLSLSAHLSLTHSLSAAHSLPPLIPLTITLILCVQLTLSHSISTCTSILFAPHYLIPSVPHSIWTSHSLFFSVCSSHYLVPSVPLDFSGSQTYLIIYNLCLGAAWGWFHKSTVVKLQGLLTHFGSIFVLYIYSICDVLIRGVLCIVALSQGMSQRWYAHKDAFIVLFIISVYFPFMRLPSPVCKHLSSCEVLDDDILDDTNPVTWDKVHQLTFHNLIFISLKQYEKKCFLTISDCQLCFGNRINRLRLLTFKAHNCDIFQPIMNDFYLVFNHTCGKIIRMMTLIIVMMLRRVRIIIILVLSLS